jgi:hypothetical protein
MEILCRVTIPIMDVNKKTHQDIEGELESDACDRWEVYRAQHLSCRCNPVSRMSSCTLYPLVILYTRQFCSSQLQSAPCTPQHPCDEEKREKKLASTRREMRNGKTYSGNSPSTRQTYCFCTCRFLIWCSICLAFLGLLPNNNKPDVNRSNRWIVRKFFKLYSLARIKTTVLWRYRPHGWTC